MASFSLQVRWTVGDELVGRVVLDATPTTTLHTIQAQLLQSFHIPIDEQKLSIYDPSKTSSAANTRCAICRNALDGPSIDQEASGNTDAALGASAQTGSQRCAHTYHKDCIERWLRTRSCCPLCNTEWVLAAAAAGDDCDGEEGGEEDGEALDDTKNLLSNMVSGRRLFNYGISKDTDIEVSTDLSRRPRRNLVVAPRGSSPPASMVAAAAAAAEGKEGKEDTEGKAGQEGAAGKDLEDGSTSIIAVRGDETVEELSERLGASALYRPSPTMGGPWDALPSGATLDELQVASGTALAYDPIDYILWFKVVGLDGPVRGRQGDGGGQGGGGGQSVDGSQGDGAAGGQGGAGGDAIGGGDRLDPAMYVSVNVTKASTVGEVLAAVRGKVAEGRWGAQLEGGEGDGGGGGDGDGKARRYDLQLTEIASFECVASDNSDEAELAKTMDVLSKVRESCTLSFTFNVAKYVLVTL